MRSPLAFIRKVIFKMRALALFSGGLDSALAIKVVVDQGIEVIALNFVSHFLEVKMKKQKNGRAAGC